MSAPTSPEERLHVLRMIAESMHLLPHGGHPRVAFGTDSKEAVDALVDLGAREQRSVNDNGGVVRVIVFATVFIGSVWFEAQYTREPSEDEREHLYKRGCSTMSFSTAGLEGGGS